MWRVSFIMFLIFQDALGRNYFGTSSCTPGSKWSTGQCAEKCRCIRKGVTHCTPNPCILIKHDPNGEVKVKEMSISVDSVISIGRDITSQVDKRDFVAHKSVRHHSRFANSGR